MNQGNQRGDSMARVLFVVPPSRGMYSHAKVKVALSERPSLTFATLASALLEKGSHVKILDLDMVEQPGEALIKALHDFSPDFVGITCVTPLYGEMKRIAATCKNYDPTTVVIVGGPHPSTFPVDSLTESNVDIVCVGEGELTIAEVVSCSELSSVPGICFKKNGQTYINPPRSLIRNLDELPYPAWGLFDLTRYKTPRLSCRANPVGGLESSRGCVFGCTFCNKTIFGRTFRSKSPKRVVDEMQYMLDQGFREIQIMDDGFTTDLKRAKTICDLMKERGMKFPWNLQNGIRVDRVDKDFIERASKVGCYRVSFGVESGVQAILDRVQKGITLDQVRRAFKWAREVGIETMAFFILGLPGETEVSMKRTIEFARELDADYAKASIFLPLPGTSVYDELEELGLIKSHEWSLYNQHDPSGVYIHPSLSWECINRYYNLFYRKFYLRPQFMLTRLKKDLFKRQSSLRFRLFFEDELVNVSFYQKVMYVTSHRNERWDDTPKHFGSVVVFALGYYTIFSTSSEFQFC